MQGKKLVQIQSAMATILREMRPNDFLTIINFSDDVQVWNDGGKILQASPENIDKAIGFVDTLEAKGGTNINGALLAGIEIVQVKIVEHNVEHFAIGSSNYPTVHNHLVRISVCIVSLDRISVCIVSLVRISVCIV